MSTRFRLGIFALLLSATVLWAGCDSGGTVGTGAAVPSVQFASSGAGAVPTDTTVQVGVTLTDSVGAEVNFEVLYASAASSTTPTDLGLDSTTTVVLDGTFPSSAGAGATQTFTLNVAGADLSTGSKEAFFALQKLESSGTVEIGEPREFSLSIGAKPITEARAEAREALINGDQVTVTIRGTVTRAFGSYARIQDDSGPTGASGMMIRQTFGELSSRFQDDINEGTIQPGTELLLTGSISQFSGILQINNEGLNSYAVVSQGDPPAPQTVTLDDIDASNQGPGGENFESELIRVEGLSFPEASGSFEEGTTYDVVNADGTSFMFRVQGPDETNIIGEQIPSGTFTYEGVLSQFNVFSGVDVDEGYQLLPMRASDIQPQ